MSETNDAQRSVLDKVAKALRRTEDRGCTPEEAAVAAEFVQRLLQEHNLTLSMIVDSDDHAESKALAKRERRQLDRRAMYRYQRDLMAALADDHFCLHRIVETWTDTWSSGNAPADGHPIRTKRHVLVGREVNVEVTVSMYDYLTRALTDQAHEAGHDHRTREGKTFLEGAVERVSERLHERRRLAEAESQASAKVPMGNGTHRELALTDVYGSEADLNNDALNGYAPGTTRQRRAEAKVRELAQRAKRQELIERGYDRMVATYMSWGYDEAAAVRMSDPNPEGHTRRVQRHRGRGWTRADDERSMRRNSSAFREGRAAGGRVGLDGQVNATDRRQIAER